MNSQRIVGRLASSAIVVGGVGAVLVAGATTALGSTAHGLTGQGSTGQGSTSLGAAAQGSTAEGFAAHGLTAQGAVAAPMSTLEVLGIFVGIPVALFVIITMLVMAPGLIRASAGQPGLSWSGRPEWFGTRPAAEQASAASGLESASASAGEDSRGALEESPTAERGGAGGRW